METPFAIAPPRWRCVRKTLTDDNLSRFDVQLKESPEAGAS